MRDVTFAIDASYNLTASRKALVQRVVQSVLGKLIPFQRFALVTFNDGIAGYQTGLYRPAHPEEVAPALSWLEDVAPRGKADFAELLHRLMSLQSPNLIVVLGSGLLGDPEVLVGMVKGAPLGTTLVIVELEQSNPHNKILSDRFPGESHHYVCTANNSHDLVTSLLGLAQGGGQNEVRMTLWAFKEELDRCFGSEPPWSTTPALLEAFDRALAATRYYEHVNLVRSELSQNKAGVAYCWFGGALALWEKANTALGTDDSTLPKPQRVNELIQAMEADLLRKRERSPVDDDDDDDDELYPRMGVPIYPNREAYRTRREEPSPYSEFFRCSRWEDLSADLQQLGGVRSLFLLSPKPDLLRKALPILRSRNVAVTGVEVPELRTGLYLDPQRRHQLDVHRVLCKLVNSSLTTPVLLLVDVDLYRSDKTEWRFSFGFTSGHLGVLTTYHLTGTQFDKMLLRYLAKVRGTFVSTSDPTSVCMDPLLSTADIDRMRLPDQAP